jgi:hypothetical protein
MTHAMEPRLRDVPLTSDDMSICNDALKILCRENGIERDAIRVSRLASIIIELWRQGMQDVEQLQLLAGATIEGEVQHPTA